MSSLAQEKKAVFCARSNAGSGNQFSSSSSMSPSMKIGDVVAVLFLFLEEGIVFGVVILDLDVVGTTAASFSSLGRLRLRGPQDFGAAGPPAHRRHGGRPRPRRGVYARHGPSRRIWGRIGGAVESKNFAPQLWHWRLLPSSGFAT
jgi:hypothetical protein